MRFGGWERRRWMKHTHLVETERVWFLAVSTARRAVFALAFQGTCLMLRKIGTQIVLRLHLISTQIA